MLSKEVSSTIFGVFGMIQPGIEPQSPRLLANDLTICIYTPIDGSTKFTEGFSV